MSRDAELAIADTIRSVVERGLDPAESPPTKLATDVYTDEARHRGEVAAILHRPVAVVASSEIEHPGDFVTARVAGVPLVVTRGHDGVVRAMHNACAHRGATVEHRVSGSARIFSCPFHGWSYEIDGSLRTVAEAERFASTECTEGLRTLPSEERHGVVWVTPTGPGLRVADWLGAELDELLAGFAMDEMVAHTATEYELDCNWKMLTDGFLETYHLKYLHRDSIAPYFPSNLIVVGRYAGADGDHFAGALPKNRLMKQLHELPRQGWQVLDHLTMAIVLVPGTVVQWQAGHVELFSIRPHPTDPTRSTCRLTMLVPFERADETELWDRNWERVCATIPGEDFVAAVDVQRNVDAGVVGELRLGATEWALAAHLDAVDRLVDQVACGDDR
jgi:phenylpropionate dioxygenase-like ring-hydroxylating dioxygenase large terminal subunit